MANRFWDKATTAKMAAAYHAELRATGLGEDWKRREIWRTIAALGLTREVTALVKASAKR